MKLETGIVMTIQFRFDLFQLISYLHYLPSTLLVDLSALLVIADCWILNPQILGCVLMRRIVLL